MFQPVWISWPKFFAVRFAPALGTFLAMAINSIGLAILSGLGSPISGFVCARMLMCGVNLTGFKLALVHFGLALVLCGLTGLLCFLGCTSAVRLTNPGL